MQPGLLYLFLFKANITRLLPSLALLCSRLAGTAGCGREENIQTQQHNTHIWILGLTFNPHTSSFNMQQNAKSVFFFLFVFYHASCLSPGPLLLSLLFVLHFLCALLSAASTAAPCVCV